MKDIAKLQYESTLQNIWAVMQAELMPSNQIDEMEIVCEMFALYDKIPAPEAEAWSGF